MVGCLGGGFTYQPFFFKETIASSMTQFNN
jgi:hypothetical protein